MDVVLRNGNLIDGTGAPARRADVGVEGGRIAAVGDVAANGAAEDKVQYPARPDAPNPLDRLDQPAKVELLEQAQDQLRLVGRQRRAAVAHIGHSVALALQVQTQQRAKARFVLDHQDVRRLTHRRILDGERFRRCQDRVPGS